MSEWYHYFNRSLNFTRRSNKESKDQKSIQLSTTGLPTLLGEIRYVCCIIFLTGLPTLLGEISCVSCIIILTRLPTFEEKDHTHELYHYLAGLPTLLEEIRCVSGIIILTGLSTLLGEVIRKAKIKNRYNQALHLTQDTTWESNKNTIKHHIQESH